MPTVLERVQKVTADQGGLKSEEVTPEKTFIDDLGFDSLGIIELVMALETEFSVNGKAIEIPDDDMVELATVRDVVAYIKAHGYASDDD